METLFLVTVSPCFAVWANYETFLFETLARTNLKVSEGVLHITNRQCTLLLLLETCGQTRTHCFRNIKVSEFVWKHFWKHHKKLIIMIAEKF